MCSVLSWDIILSLDMPQIDPDQRPAALAPPFTGHFRVILDTPRGLQSLHPGTRPPNLAAQPGAPAINGAAKPTSTPTPASLELRSSIYQTTAKSSRAVSEAEANALANAANEPNGTDRQVAVKYQCDTCGVDCTAERYHSLKQKNFELCPMCYMDGRFPTTMFSGDFVKLTAVSSVGGVRHGSGSGVDDDWTDQEILLLLEGVEMYDDDWSAIEEHVGSRSAQQCIRKFLQLPIEDPYVQTEGDMGPLRYARLPFEQADNPVMSVVAFLAGVVNPGVAAEAAKAALHALTDDDKMDETEEGRSEEKLAAGTSTEKPAEDRMDEDAPKDSSAHPAEPSASESLTTHDASSDSMVVDSESAPHKPTATLPHSKVQRAAALALKSSAKAARALAEAEDTQIKSTVATLIKLTLTKLELKMAQFEELESLLEDERRSLESARMALVGERVGLRKTLETVRAELAKAQNGGPSQGVAVAAQQVQGALTSTGQGTRLSEVPVGTPMDASAGPIPGGNVAQLS